MSLHFDNLNSAVSFSQVDSKSERVGVLKQDAVPTSLEQMEMNEVMVGAHYIHTVAFSVIILLERYITTNFRNNNK